MDYLKETSNPWLSDTTAFTLFQMEGVGLLGKLILVSHSDLLQIWTPWLLLPGMDSTHGSFSSLFNQAAEFTSRGGVSSQCTEGLNNDSIFCNQKHQYLGKIASFHLMTYLAAHMFRLSFC